MDGKQSPSEEPTWQFKPGETISPRSESSAGAPTPAAQAAQQPSAVAAPSPTPPVPTPAAPPSSEPAPTTPATDETSQDSLPAEEYSDSAEPALSWTASEYIAHDKTAGWHFGLVAVAVLAAAVLWFITKDVVTSVVVIVAGAVLSLYGARRPGELQYELSNSGISIGPKHFHFTDFRAFSIVPEGAFASIALLPTKRFAPMTTLYFAPEDGDAILAILGNHLPQQPMKVDPIDSLMRKIRF